MSELQDLEITKNKLLEDINKLQAQESNLRASIHQEEIRLEGVRKLDEQKELGKVQVKLDKLYSKESQLEAKERTLLAKGEEIDKRLSDLDVRENQVKDLDKKVQKFYEEQRNFEMYKNKITKELQEAQTKAAEFKDIEDRLKSKESDLVAKRKALDLRDKEYMDRVGQLVELEKRVTIETEHLEALKKEMVNV